jgi:hypothetical protein
MHHVIRSVLEGDEELISTAGKPAPALGICLDYSAATIRRGVDR